MTTSSRTEPPDGSPNRSSDGHPRRPTRRPPPQKLSPWGFVGMGGFACVLFLDLGTADVAPWWVTTLFVVLWVVLLAIGVRWFVPHPGRVPWLPLLAFAVWLPTISLGTRQLGWGG